MNTNLKQNCKNCPFKSDCPFYFCPTTLQKTLCLQFTGEPDFNELTQSFVGLVEQVKAKNIYLALRNDLGKQALLNVN